MRLQLTLLSGPDVGRRFEFQTGELVVIGRGRGCDVQLGDPRVSKSHCRILADDGRILIRDEGSHWGTVVNDETVPECELQPGDVIRLGGTELRLDVASTPSATTLAPPRRVDASLEPSEADAMAKTSAAPIIPTKRPVPPPQAAPGANLNALVGTRLNRYRIETVVARASMGMVFRALDEEKKRGVALKILWPELSAQQDNSQRFLRAIRTMMPIKHKNLIRLYGAGRTSGYCFMAMEFVKGESVAKLIQRIGIAGMLPWKRSFRVLLHVARALEVAHEHNVVHRNITPQNILIREHDQAAKLGDLMLAKALEGTLAESVTRSGDTVGELAYISPEQSEGLRKLDHRSDLYSLGATVYAVLTGRPPFEATSPARLIADIESRPPDPPTKYHMSIPDRFADVVLRLLKKRPEDRFESPTALIRELEQLAKLEGLSADELK